MKRVGRCGWMEGVWGLDGPAYPWIWFAWISGGSCHLHMHGRKPGVRGVWLARISIVGGGMCLGFPVAGPNLWDSCENGTTDCARDSYEGHPCV